MFDTGEHTDLAVNWHEKFPSNGQATYKKKHVKEDDSDQELFYSASSLEILTRLPISWPTAHQTDKTVNRYWCDAGTNSTLQIQQKIISD